MMSFLAAMLFFALTICGLAIGVIISNKRLKGSCGGLNTVTDENGEAICGLCNHPVHDCQNPDEKK